MPLINRNPYWDHQHGMYGYEFTSDLYYSIGTLAGASVYRRPRLGTDCGNVYALEYKTEAIPTPLRPIVQEMARLYSEGATRISTIATQKQLVLQCDLGNGCDQTSPKEIIIPGQLDLRPAKQTITLTSDCSDD